MSTDVKGRMQGRSISPDLQDKLERARWLPSVPPVVERLLALWGNGREPGIVDVARVIGGDAAMAAKVLRFVNSAAFGLAEPVKSLTHAVTLLGVRRARNVALTFSLMPLAQGQGDAYRRIWRRAVLGSIVAAELAPIGPWSGASADEAGLAALFQDIGSLVLLVVIGRDYEALVMEAGEDHAMLPEREERLFGSDHASVGAWLLRRWMFPETLVNAVARSHGAAAGETDVSRLIAAAGAIADAWTSKGDEGDSTASPLEGDPVLAALARTEARLAQVGSLFNVDVSSELELPELARRVRRILAT